MTAVPDWPTAFVYAVGILAFAAVMIVAFIKM